MCLHKHLYAQIGEMDKKNFSKLSGQIGENLVVAEQGRRGILATAFAGNVPDIDILAYKDKRSIPIQVKALRTGNPFFVRKYRFESDQWY